MSEKPKVLIVATHPVQYQAPWFRYLEKNIEDYDFEVLYLTIPDAEKQGVGFGKSFEWDIPLLDGYGWRKVDDKFLSGNEGLDKFSSIKLRNSSKLLEYLKPDIVFLTGWQCMALLQLLIACNRSKIPALIRGDSNNLKPRKVTTRILHKLLLSRYDKFLAVGQANRNFYLENNVKESDIHFCPHFIDNDFFRGQTIKARHERKKLRLKYDIPESAFCFCYVGKLNSKKRIMDVLFAFEQLGNPNSHLLVVGDGELMDQAKQYVNSNKPDVSFTGFLNQSEICYAYSVSDCLVLASDYDETWGLVVNEAMACGVPAIVSNRCGCHCDLIIEGETGYIFEFANIDDLVRKMDSMLKLSEQSYLNICKQAQEHVMNKYSMENATKGFVKALNRCLKR